MRALVDRHRARACAGRVVRGVLSQTLAPADARAGPQRSTTRRSMGAWTAWIVVEILFVARAGALGAWRERSARGWKARDDARSARLTRDGRARAQGRWTRARSIWSRERGRDTLEMT